MAPRQSPTLRLRRLGAELKRIRERQKLSALQVTGALGWSESKLNRIENGIGTLPQLKNVKALLDHYEVHGPERDNAIALTLQARQRSWWHLIKDALEPGYATYIGLEDEASRVRVHDGNIIPSLLQTDEYAAANLRGQMPGIPDDAFDLHMDVLRNRKELLRAESPLDLWAIVDEAALRRTVGGPEVMREQLAHLVEMGRLRHVHLQVLPFSAGAHAGVCPFVIVDFADSVAPESVYLRTVARTVWMEERAHVVRFRLAFESMVKQGLSVRASRTFIEKLLSELG